MANNVCGARFCFAFICILPQSLWCEMVFENHFLVPLKAEGIKFEFVCRFIQVRVRISLCRLPWLVG